MLVETDFLPTLDTPASVCFIFSSKGNIILNAFWLVEMHVLASGSHFASISQFQRIQIL